MSVYRQGRTAVGSCPRCSETLLPVEGSAGVRFCEKCGGVFADVASSKRILLTLDRTLLAIGFDAGLGKPRQRHDERRLTCPECQIEMIRNRVEAAVCEVDACPLHGTWFDAGELEAVIRVYANARKRGLNVSDGLVDLMASKTVPR